MSDTTTPLEEQTTTPPAPDGSENTSATPLNLSKPFNFGSISDEVERQKRMQAEANKAANQEQEPGQSGGNDGGKILFEDDEIKDPQPDPENPQNPDPENPGTDGLETPPSKEDLGVINEGVKSLVEINDYILSNLIAWLNGTANAAAWAANATQIGILQRNWSRYFKALGIQFSEGNGVIAAHIVVYGKGIVLGCALWIKRMFFTKKPAAEAQQNFDELTPEQQEQVIKADLARIHADRMKKQGYIQCACPACEDDEQFNMGNPRWFQPNKPGQEFCSKSCAGKGKGAKKANE